MFCRECTEQVDARLLERLLLREGHVLRQRGRDILPGVAFRGIQVIPSGAARSPVSEELTREGRAGWLFEPGDRASLQAALENAAASHPRAIAAKGAAALEQARLLSWAEIGERMAELLRMTERRGGSH